MALDLGDRTKEFDLNHTWTALKAVDVEATDI